MGFGGGSTAIATVPAYIETQHTTWLNAVDGLIDILQPEASPYNTAFAYDPTPQVIDMEESRDRLTDFTADLDPVTDFDTYWANAVAEVDGDMLSDAYLTTLANEFEANLKEGYYRGVNRFTGAMRDINAVHNSSFVIGMALMERGLNAQVGQFLGQLKARREAARQGAILQTVQVMAQMQSNQLRGKQIEMQLQVDQSRAAIIAFEEQTLRNIEYDAADLMWDFDLYDRGANVLSSVFGAPTSPRKTPLIPSILGGAFSGASLGAQSGGMLGPEGALLGLLGGGALGGIGGLF